MTGDVPVAAPVTLVGAGPGDLDLLTLDAEAALRAPREVIADRSLAPLLQTLAAERRDQDADEPFAVTLVDDDVAVGDELVAAIGCGPGVVRLYRGDPWAHPAGDAERAALRAVGLTWSTVPGVLAELAALATAGIPVQVRDLAVTATFLVDEHTHAITVPVDPAHALVVRTTDLGATASRLVTRTMGDDGTGDRPVALVPADGVEPVRVTLADLPGLVADRSSGRDVALDGAGLLVVGLVAALDLRVATTAATAGVGR